MPTFKTFEDIEAWQDARELTQRIYAISNSGAFSIDFGLKKQIRDAAVSIMSNIAEGFERNGRAEFIQFLAIAKGSLGEVRSQMYVALDQGYISKEEFAGLVTLANETGRKIGALISYLNKSGMRGSKFRLS